LCKIGDRFERVRVEREGKKIEMNDKFHLKVGALRLGNG